MEFVIAKNLEDAQTCDRLLNELVKFESKIDSIINENYIVKNLYSRVLDNEDVFLCIAKQDQIVLGYIMARLVHKKGSSYKTNIVTIESMFIKNEYRKQSVGTNLIAQVENWAKQRYGEYTLEITALNQNLGANNCYKKLGFKPVKTTYRK